MINIFKKKPKECKHKYKDFPWYVIPIEHPTGLLFDIKIMEPYVCLLCKKRVDKELGMVKDVLRKNVPEEIERLREQYKSEVKDVVIVEDMINDFQLVDKSFVESYEYSQKITEDIMKSMQETTPGSLCSVSEAIGTLNKSCPENQVKENKSGSNNSELLDLISDIKETFSKNTNNAPDPREILSQHNVQREKCILETERKKIREQILDTNNNDLRVQVEKAKDQAKSLQMKG